ncbi:hypothetical protein HPP92_003088 [Vanilla planifolia]|uniref:Uncharacterized protein n=1 Tax=Vanilla planifolia TaxID=51239 RepID=A0A835S2Y4_VANPL|nr:hypothetical protein HPP92_003088 [Vanilla planifolia]
MPKTMCCSRWAPLPPPAAYVAAVTAVVGESRSESGGETGGEEDKLEVEMCMSASVSSASESRIGLPGREEKGGCDCKHVEDEEAGQKKRHIIDLQESKRNIKGEEGALPHACCLP